MTTKIVRKESTGESPEGKITDKHDSADNLVALFQAKNLNELELAALLGAHTVSKSFFQTPKGRGDAGLAQDSTPGIWDVRYYSETTKPSGDVFVFESDMRLANHSTVGPAFGKFVDAQARWDIFFSRALTKMSLFGAPNGGQDLVDCTKYIPKGTQKRDIRAAPINARWR